MSSASAESQDVPKAILYSWKTSVWASVPLLCLHEKGYSEDEYIVKQVDISKLSSDTMTSLVHLPTVDPNFLYLAARDVDELNTKANSVAGAYIVDRAEALNRYIAEAEQQMQQKGGDFASHDHAKNGTNGGGVNSFEARTVQFLKEKKEANDVLYAIYKRQAGKEREQGFFDASIKAWTESLPDVLNKLEQEIKGPYALGDQVSLADLHIISWLARLIQIANGDVSPDAILAVEKQMGNGHHVGEKLKQFWASWIQRESFRKVWVNVDPEFDEDSQIQAWLNVI
ncbi:hypothetical protein QFC22_000074 [Naganishia vaughanmartiniae]|uniref:Uncharacterized protein n=1 Tax=Naganishia vaughanmartiniae TaxID=1424756 RepID=A0ACC2XND5_9TREE|nr:hypothetical protein QFC22_000074 [Naganishia vaughanmartiniae]